MEVVHAVFRQEDTGWSAHCPEAPGYRAFAASLEEVMQLAHGGIPFYLDRAVRIVDIFESVAGVPNGTIAATNALQTVMNTTGGAGGLIVTATGAEPATVPSPVASKVPAQQVA